MHRPSDILGFWFDGASGDAEIGRDSPAYRRWFGRLPEVDAHIISVFGDDVARARAGLIDTWGAEPRGALALILLLDQFPRHMFRGDRRAFESDEKALEIAHACIDAGTDEILSIPERVFLYLPIQHSERLADHDLALERIGSLVELARHRGSPLLKMCEAGLRSEQEHVEDLRRFGRYPYRNAALGRESTPEELAWLRARGEQG